MPVAMSLLERRLRLHALQLVVIAVEHDGRCGAARRQRFVKLALRVRRVERAHDRANLPRAHLRDEKLWAVGQAQRDSVPGHDLSRHQRGGERVALSLELRVRDAVSLEEHDGTVRIRARALRHVVEKRAVRVRRERRRNVGVVVGEPGARVGHRVSADSVSTSRFPRTLRRSRAGGKLSRPKTSRPRWGRAPRKHHAMPAVPNVTPWPLGYRRTQRVSAFPSGQVYVIWFPRSRWSALATLASWSNASGAGARIAGRPEVVQTGNGDNVRRSRSFETLCHRLG